MTLRRLLPTLAVLAVVGVAAALTWGGNGGGDDPGRSGDGSGGTGQVRQEPGGVPGSGTPQEPGSEPRPGSNPEPSPETGQEVRLEASSCPAELSNCVVASGRVIYVEAVDPDGDGDAHFVTTSRESVSLPGITIFDVKAELRPDSLPGVGDLVGGAGPVYPGSRGQKQVEVVEFHVAR